MSNSIRRLLHLIAALGLGIAACLVALQPASASAAVPDAAIRAAHFSPTTPGVDVYLGKFSGGGPPTTLWLSEVHYGAVSPYQPLTPGVYTVAMRPAGASSKSPPVLTWTLHAKPHAAYTVAGVGAGSSVRGVVVQDDLSAPPPGKGRVRVIQAASRAPIVTVSAAGGHLISSGVHFATVSGYRTLPAGRWSVQAVSTSNVSEAARAPVTVHNGQITSILLLDAKTAGITLRTVLDSASSGVMPRDAVPAGRGGAASHIVNRPTGGSGLGLVAFGGAGALLSLCAVCVLIRRTRGASRNASRATG